MRVEITHNVDRVPGQVYNFLVYDFVFSDKRIRARAYVDDMDVVSFLGVFGPEGALRLDESGQPFVKNPVEEFPDVVHYLRRRFQDIQALGPRGYESVTLPPEGPDPDDVYDGEFADVELRLPNAQEDAQ